MKLKWTVNLLKSRVRIHIKRMWTSSIEGSKKKRRLSEWVFGRGILYPAYQAEKSVRTLSTPWERPVTRRLWKSDVTQERWNSSRIDGSKVSDASVLNLMPCRFLQIANNNYRSFAVLYTGFTGGITPCYEGDSSMYRVPSPFSTVLK